MGAGREDPEVLALDAGHRTQAIDQLVQSILGDVYLRRRFIEIDEAGSHRGRERVEVADVLQHLDREPTQSVESASLSERAAVALDELLLAKRLRVSDDDLRAPARDDALVNEAVVIGLPNTSTGYVFSKSSSVSLASVPFTDSRAASTSASRSALVVPWLANSASRSLT